MAFLGVLGSKIWHRCDACGIDFADTDICPACGADDDPYGENAEHYSPVEDEEEVGPDLGNLDGMIVCDECEEGLVTDIHNDPVRFCDCPAGVVAFESYLASAEENDDV